MKRSLKKTLLVALGVYLLLLLLVLGAFLVGEISVNQLGIGYAALMIFSVIALTVTIQRNRIQSNVEPMAIAAASDAKEREANRKSARNYIVVIVIMCLLLVYGLRDRNGYPSWVTFIGASINIGIIYALVSTVRSKIRHANRGKFSSEQ